MSQLTDGFIIKLLETGKTPQEASSILSNILFSSFMDLYKSRNLSKENEKDLDIKLKKLIKSKASKDRIFTQLGITPIQYLTKLKENIQNYQA